MDVTDNQCLGLGLEGVCYVRLIKQNACILVFKENNFNCICCSQVNNIPSIPNGSLLSSTNMSSVGTF